MIGKLAAMLAVAAGLVHAQQLPQVRRICIEDLTGDRTASQIRDMIIASLQRSNAFQITENPARADAILKGSAEDLVFTETHQSNDGVSASASLGSIPISINQRGNHRLPSASVGENESEKVSERKHEAFAAVRLVNKEGDVIWSTTQESLGAKFRGASADVADKVMKQLLADIEKAKKDETPK
jgi:hypothetical protein